MEITKDGFSYHTFEMTKKIDFNEYRYIRNTFHKINGMYKGRIYQKGKSYISEQFGSVGVNMYLLRSKNLPTYFILKVNPLFLIAKKNYFSIFTSNIENIVKVRDEINNILDVIGANFRFEDMSISRIDLCVNLEMDSSEIIDAYMRLFKKCQIPCGYILDKFSKEKENYKEINKHSLHASSTNTIINIYDKSFQVKEENLDLNQENYIDNMLRVEIGLMRPAIYQIMQKYEGGINQLSNIDLLEFMGKYSKMLIEEYLLKFLTPGVYIPYSEVEKIIQKTDYEKKIKIRMRKFLEKVSECKNMNAAIKQIEEEYSLTKKQTDYILSNFNDLGINPITLKNDQSHLQSLPSLFDLLGMSLKL